MVERDASYDSIRQKARSKRLHFDLEFLNDFGLRKRDLEDAVLENGLDVVRLDLGGGLDGLIDERLFRVNRDSSFFSDLDSSLYSFLPEITRHGSQVMVSSSSVYPVTSTRTTRFSSIS